MRSIEQRMNRIERTLERTSEDDGKPTIAQLIARAGLRGQGYTEEEIIAMTPREKGRPRTLAELLQSIDRFDPDPERESIENTDKAA